jgi:hypothetical protein
MPLLLRSTGERLRNSSAWRILATSDAYLMLRGSLLEDNQNGIAQPQTGTERLLTFRVVTFGASGRRDTLNNNNQLRVDDTGAFQGPNDKDLLTHTFEQMEKDDVSQQYEIRWVC